MQQHVDVGGICLALERAGRGIPTVVFEAGGMATRASWDRVWPAVVEVSHVIRYDRAGLGASERSPHSRTIRQMVAELHALLQRSTASPPYVLVGHSFGGQIVRVFAGMYPDVTAGLVLVDPAQEDLFQHMTPLLSEDGRTAFLASWDAVPNHPEDLSYARLSEIEEGLRTVGRNLPAIPLIVLSSGNTMAWEAIAPPWWPVHHFMRVSHLLHQELASLSAHGKVIVAERSGHAIQDDEPALVIEAIREVVESARRAGRRRAGSPDL